jgi:hypothetical protein
MQIPRKLRVGKLTYNVQLVRRTPPPTPGRISLDKKQILVATHGLKDRPRPRKRIETTFWHEVTHAVLYDMGHRLNNDENFVNAFSERLAQAVRTAKL